MLLTSILINVILGSKSFRKYLSKSEITEIVGRDDSDIDRVAFWLRSFGVSEYSVHPHRDWITATTTVATVEKLFSCSISNFVNTKSGRSKLATLGSYVSCSWVIFRV